MPLARFRDGLLAGRTVALAGDPARLAALGAAVAVAADPWALDEAGADAWAADLVGRHGRLDGLVLDAGEPFGPGGGDALARTLDATWRLVRAVASAAMIPEAGGGAIVLVGPRPGAGPHAEAARAALENLARTLSVEWARFGLRATMIAPGDGTTAAEVEDLVAWLLSPAGDYVSGCRLALGSL